MFRSNACALDANQEMYCLPSSPKFRDDDTEDSDDSDDGSYAAPPTCVCACVRALI
jgi:hypothetical protein